MISITTTFDKKSSITVLLCFLLLVSINSYSQKLESVEVSKEILSYKLKEAAFILKDEQGKLTPKEAWKSMNYQSFSLGLIDTETENYWLKIKLSNLDTVEQQLFISLFFLDEVTVFHYSEATGKLIEEKQKSGYLVPMEERSVKVSQTAVATIKLAPKKERVYLFHIRNYSEGGKTVAKSAFKMGFMAYTTFGFDFIYLQKLHFSYAILGVLFTILISNLGIFVWVREWSFGALAIHNFAFFFWIFATGGLLIDFGIIDNFNTDRTLRHIALVLLNVTYPFYAKNFLELRKNFKLGNILFNIIIAFQFVTVGVILFSQNYALTLILSRISTVPMFLLAFVSGGIALRKKQSEAIYFIVASAVMLLASSIFIYMYDVDSSNYLKGHLIVQIGMALEVIIFSVGVIYKLSQHKKKAVELQIQNALEIQKSGELQEELDLKNRKLTGNAALIISRNDKITRLQQGVKSVTKEKKSTKENLAQLVEKELKNLLNFENDWADFKLHFEDVHPNFFKTLKERFPKLTQGDIRIAAFLKMKLTTKEIATVLGVSVRAIEQARTRLRKKMDIAREMNVNEFLAKV